MGYSRRLLGIWHRAIIGCVVLTSCFIHLGCSGGSPTAPGPSVPVPVTQTLRVITSDGRLLGTTTYSGTSAEMLTVSIADIANRGINISSIDPDHAVIREDNVNGQVGAYVVHTTNGRLTFQPTTSIRILWGMNNSNGADYAGAFAGRQFNVGTLGSALSRGLRRTPTRHYTVSRLTAATLPQGWEANHLVDDLADSAPLIDCLAVFNDMMAVNGVKYLETVWREVAEPDLRAGFARPVPGYILGNYSGIHTSIGYFWVNPFSLATPGGGPTPYATLRAICIAEAVEEIMQYDNPFGAGTTALLFGYSTRLTDTIQVLPVAKDYYRFGALMPRP